MRILIRTSKTAIWARWLGGLAVPVLVIPVVMHRLRWLTGDLFLVAMVLACIIAVLAVGTAIVALARLWQSGDQGWNRALGGLVMGLLCLAPFAWYGNLALTYPPVTDIATIERGAMPLVFEPGTAAMPPPRTLTREQIAALFPNVETREYPLTPEQAYEVVLRQVTSLGWDLRLQRPPLGSEPGRINAQIMTWPGWREEAVFRIEAGPEGSRVDMRSASLHAFHDFGSNGTRIETFLSALDDEVTVLLRDNPSTTQPVDAEAEETGESETDAEAEEAGSEP
ncbi:DUF1499 domain-containing protein [Devosia sp. 919]|uniref:DUF1499 domain-containing protein n=1 Tax=Devosia sp. 919 TaxID=2726065 RepID=UPI001551B3F6